MKRRDFALTALAPLWLTACGGGSGGASGPQGEAATALRRAADYMDEVVSYRGGYVWSYSPDLKQTFGEMEAYRTMCWIQPPGTPSVGHVYLDAYHATGDDRFYQAAERTTLAIIAAQHASGGWNYIHDFAGEESLKKWYDTIGKNGWRLEEFQHYYGNATFDDAGTAVASQLLLRMYVEKRDVRFLAPLQKAIDFVLNAQFGPEYGVANGGWPQRFPHFPGSVSSMPSPHPEQVPAGAHSGMEDGDYTLHVTFNDDVMGENIKFLTMCVMALGETRLLGPIARAMECMRLMQQTGPQAGWSLQHLSRPKDGRPAGAPAGARSYEPRSLATHTTQTNIRQLFNYFQLTGDRRYLARIPEAIAWLKTCPLPAAAIAGNALLGGGRTHPTFVELGTNAPLYVHRYGSNIHNGGYYADKDWANTVSHYSAGRAIDIAGLESTYQKLSSMTDAAVADMAARSPLKSGTAGRSLPRYFSIREVDFPDLFTGAAMPTPNVPDAEARTLVDELGSKGYWTSPVPEIVNPYQGDGPAAAYTGTAYRSKHVGDAYDTSPYPADAPPEVAPYVKRDKPQFIVTSEWIRRMGRLIAYVAPQA
ncbi:pectate lyase [Paracidovorax valerianellae]|uniref:Pectic acid lyase n=1 Tax=Paracidovorax valerianellae TaxID=187868 RepID=A0A1G7B050_9BURK|nr:pectate lyase [Paracidovorax valerianellae]MDA8445642.1 pectate lyase [Paracidovorax valerianellae]SDE19625.1 Pectic acid lyase [Paracidovorax valerianellae]